MTALKRLQLFGTWIGSNAERVTPVRAYPRQLSSFIARLGAAVESKLSRLEPPIARAKPAIRRLGKKAGAPFVRGSEGAKALVARARTEFASRRESSSLVNDILGLQLLITAAIGVFALVGLTWTSQAITDENLSRWATRWASQLNELGAPLYVADPDLTILNIERFVAAYPEISKVDWYSPQGIQQFSVTQDGYTPSIQPEPLPTEVIAEIQVDPLRNAARLLSNEGSASGHYRLVGAIWSESFSGDSLMLLGADEELTTIREILGFVALDLDYSWYEAVLANRLLVGSLVLFLVLAFSWAFSRHALKTALRPLSQLQEPLSKLADGDMNVRFAPARHEEIQNIITTLRRTTKALRERDRRLSHLATHDALTGLFNRPAFVDELTAEIQRLEGTKKQSAILFIDLDQFKYINDTCGHPAGDELLRMAARSINATTRSDDVVARFGGDEFAVLARNVTPTRATRIGEKILEHMSLLTQVHDNKVFHLQCSIGVAMVRNSALDAHEYLSRADIACHAAKDNGRNRLEMYKTSRKENTQMANEVAWVQKIRQALEGDGFTLVYQPLLRISAGWTDHYEVLLRLRTDEGELISPDAFLPAAVRFGLMLDIDYWVAENAIASLARHQSPRTDLNYSINLSASVFETDRFGKHVEALLRKHEVRPEAIIFEITEQTAVRFAAESDKQIQRLRELGCRFAIDDFGKGYSSFSYLKQLSVDYLKIDGSFVLGLENDKMNQTFIRVMGEVARAVRMETIAECVENAETLALLDELGIDYAQGHYISHPTEQPTELEIKVPRKPERRRRRSA
jgi:diguanylate cyclase (GGDEF)-like protein